MPIVGKPRGYEVFRSLRTIIRVRAVAAARIARRQAAANRRDHMRQIALAALAVAVTTVATTCASSAQSYPWCLVNARKSGATSCAFVSREQCMLSAGGNAGHCIANPAYASARKP
jgi:uncharacterized protein DUF3551